MNMTPLLVTLQWLAPCSGPDGCGSDRGVVWQGSCGCYVFKCCLCGVLGWAYCGEEQEEHEAEFNYLAEATT